MTALNLFFPLAKITLFTSASILVIPFQPSPNVRRRNSPSHLVACNPSFHLSTKGRKGIPASFGLDRHQAANKLCGHPPSAFIFASDGALLFCKSIQFFSSKKLAIAEKSCAFATRKWPGGACRPGPRRDCQRSLRILVFASDALAGAVCGSISGDCVAQRRRLA